MRKSIYFKRSPIFVFLLLLPSVAASQFSLNNTDFDVDLSGWSIDAPTSATWDNRDINNSLSSGSVKLTNNLNTANSQIEVLSQCIKYPQIGVYSYKLSAYIPSGQTTNGSVVMASLRYGSNDCSDTLFGAGGYTVVDSSTLDTWQSITGEFVADGISSIKYVIAIRKTEADGTFLAYADSAMLWVDKIFSDSFE